MLFGTNQRTKIVSLEVKYRYNIISFTKTYKYLWVKLDQALALREHTSAAYRKATGRLYLLKRIRPYLTVEAALTIYKTMIIPIFTYCSIVTSISNKTHNEKIKRFEKRAKEIIYGPNIPRKNTTTIELLGRKRLCLQVFNCLSGNVCENFKSYFELTNNETRNKNKLIRLPVIKLECARKSFYFNGAKQYNDLPLIIRTAETKENFITLLDKKF